MRLNARAWRTTEVLTVTIPYLRGTTTVLNLQRVTPTSASVANPEHRGGLSDAAIGAIVGSLLGALVLGFLIYCCCFRTSVDDDSDDSDSSQRNTAVFVSENPRNTAVSLSEKGLPFKDTIGRKQPYEVRVTGKKGDWIRPPRRKRAPVMNE